MSCNLIFPLADEVPLQITGFNCGLFLLKYADFYAQGKKFTFNHKDMENFRHQIKQELNYHRIVFDFQNRPHEPFKYLLEPEEDDYLIWKYKHCIII